MIFISNCTLKLYYPWSTNRLSWNL